MAMRHALPAGFFLTVAAFAYTAVPGAAVQEAPVRTGGVQDQFAISLPSGWSLYDQDEAISGKPGPFGVVFFSAQPVKQPESSTADASLFAKVDTGEILSFFVDRSKAAKSMTCARLSKSDIYNIGKRINQDRSIATAGRRMFGGGLAPPHTDIEVGGCHGVRFQLEANKENPEKHWKIDARAVSDGKVLYLFSVRHRGVYFEDSLAVFEKAMSTVQFKQAK
jgi:hypothetical protein